MRRRTFLRHAAAGAAAAALSPRPARAAAAPPNIVLILADDLGARDLACTGNTFVETPRIDRLAAEGMRFTQAYAAAPVCSPTRASLLTGRWPARIGLTNVIEGTLTQRDSPVLEAPHLGELPAGCTTLAQRLHARGYHCAHIGKWHLGGPGALPAGFGFDEQFAGNADGGVKGYHWPKWSTVAPDGQFPDGANLTDMLADAACEYIARRRDAPFFLMLSHYAPHEPLDGPPALVAKYAAKAAANPERFHSSCDPAYAALIEGLDASVGRVIDALDALGLAQNTLVVFCSDNGGRSLTIHGKPTPTSNAPLREGKGYLYEGGIRVPLIVRRPGVVAAGAQCHHPVLSNDLYATCCAAAGCPPDGGPGAADAVDLGPLLRDPGAGLPRETLFWHYPHFSNRAARPCGAVRKGPWKLIEFYEDGSLTLFHLDEDPSETRNRALDFPEQARVLQALLRQWLAETGAKLPQPNPAFTVAQAAG